MAELASYKEWAEKRFGQMISCLQESERARREELQRVQTAASQLIKVCPWLAHPGGQGCSSCLMQLPQSPVVRPSALVLQRHRLAAGVPECPSAALGCWLLMVTCAGEGAAGGEGGRVNGWIAEADGGQLPSSSDTLLSDLQVLMLPDVRRRRSCWRRG